MFREVLPAEGFKSVRNGIFSLTGQPLPGTNDGSNCLQNTDDSLMGLVLVQRYSAGLSIYCHDILRDGDNKKEASF